MSSDELDNSFAEGLQTVASTEFEVAQSVGRQLQKISRHRRVSKAADKESDDAAHDDGLRDVGVPAGVANQGVVEAGLLVWRRHLHVILFSELEVHSDELGSVATTRLSEGQAIVDFCW
jgi:hypothetical protein